MREVVGALPARVLPFSLQTLVRDAWIALIGATSLHVGGAEASVIRAAARKWLPAYLLTGPRAFHFTEPVPAPPLQDHDGNETAGSVPYAVDALVESGRLPAALAAPGGHDWGDLAEDIDAVLATPDLDPEVRGPLTLAGAYAYVCFESLLNGDSYLRASRAMTLLMAVPESVDDDTPGDGPSLYKHIKWQVEGEHGEETGGHELLRRANVELHTDDGDRSLAADLYTSVLRAHATDPAPRGLPYGTLQHIAEKAQELSSRNEELARPLLQAVATAVPAAMLPYSVQLAICDTWQRLGDPDAARTWLPPHLTT